MVPDPRRCTSGTTTASSFDDVVHICIRRPIHFVWHDAEPILEQSPEDIEHEYYLEIPQKIKPAKSLTMKPILKIKQPMARAGFKRGQRNGKI